jgi:predicted aspartyl protease
MIQTYSFAYYPPIPVLKISVALPDQDEWFGPFSAIVDSGADFTIIPLTILAPIEPRTIGSANMVSQWQDRRPVDVYLVDVQLGGVRLARVEVAGDPYSDELILGRNVLNALNLRLDGPNLQVELAE